MNISINSNIQMGGGCRITNLDNPVDNKDVSNKIYVDNSIATLSTTLNNSISTLQTNINDIVSGTTKLPYIGNGFEYITRYDYQGSNTGTFYFFKGEMFNLLYYSSIAIGLSSGADKVGDVYYARYLDLEIGYPSVPEEEMPFGPGPLLNNFPSDSSTAQSETRPLGYFSIINNQWVNVIIRVVNGVTTGSFSANGGCILYTPKRTYDKFGDMLP